MTNSDAHDVLSTLGETLTARRRELLEAVADARARLEAFDAAWERHDHAWMTGERFISERLFERVQRAYAALEK